ncbi:efflux RND transporter permease subunit [Treponema primitia]|uniref:efflux RND transporter permease subunit n=1 Tax=Treponema primitia TaxID=88058 RepID=UPI0039804B00
MNVVDLSIKRPVLTLMVLLAFVIFGILAYVSLPVSLFPDMSSPMVTIQTIYSGASPQVVETQLTKKIEDQVFAIGDLDSITSYSMDSVSVITASFKYGKDENTALQEVKDKVEVIIADLPLDAKRPAISKIDIASAIPVMQIVLEGDMDSTELYTLASTTIGDQLSQVSGVGSINLSGGDKREITVELNRATVFERAVPIEQIAGLLAAANLELPGGSIETADQDIPVRFKGEFTSLDEISNLDVPTAEGVFKLRQLGDVRDTHTVVRERTILLDKGAGTRNEGAILLSVVKNPTANSLDVIDGVIKRIPRIEAESGGHIRLKVIQEDATFIRNAVNDTLGNVVLGIILTALVLLFFLHDARSTLIVALAMPFSVIATFFIMKPLNIGINVLSLMGLSCATGTLVANSVVVLENIFRYKEQGLSRHDSASRGTREVMLAVFASTLTNVAVFVPLGNMGGGMGKILSDFAFTIVISTVFSIIVSFTLTPLMASRILPLTAKRDGPLGRKLESLFKKWEDLYGRSISFLLKRKRRSALVVAVVLVVFILSIAAFPLLNIELMAKSDGGKIQVDVELPQGSDLDATAAVLAEIEKRLAAYTEVETVLTALGSMGSMTQDVSVARVDIALVPKKERTRSNSDIAAAMTATLKDIPGAAIRVLPPSEIVISQGAPIDLYLQGTDNETLQDIGNRLKNRIEKVPGAMNVMVNSKAGKTELLFEPNRKRLSEDGLTVQAVAVSLRAAVDGLVTTTYKENGQEYDIRVKLADSALTDIEDLRNIPIVSRAGVNPLSWYADIRFDNGYNMIMRVNRFRTVEITSELLPGYSQSSSLSAVMKAAGEIKLPEGYTLKQAGMSEAMGDSIVDMLLVFVIAVLLVYMLLAAVLESFIQPLFILATVPLSLIGVIVGCLLTNTVLNVVSMLGIIMLVGVVVNNAILILDYYNQLKREGAGVQEALIKACPTKLKPILMSNIAIVLGMLPMALGIGESMAEIRQPMGVVIIGGIISATFLTFWLIPSLEYVRTSRSKLNVQTDKEGINAAN